METYLHIFSIQQLIFPTKKMGKSSSSASSSFAGKKKTSSSSSKGTIISTRKRKPTVEVIKCPSDFPGSNFETSTSRKRRHGTTLEPTTANGRELNNNNTNKKKNNSSTSSSSSSVLLDWHETAREVRSYGATAFTGKLKREYQDEQYQQLTGRDKKKQKVPLPIVRGIRKASIKRERQIREEAREAGIVLPTAKKEKERDGRKSVRHYESYGPAPNIGFMKNGIFRVSKNKTGKR